MAEKSISVVNFSGGVNTDIADELLPPGMYRYGRNIRIFSDGKQGVITNVKGNIEILFSQPEGRNVTIGAKEDTENNKFYFFNWNENGYHVIYQYDVLLNKVNPIIRNITDTGDIDILKFQEKALILHIDIKGDLLYWTDGVNNARKINIKKALDKSDDGYGDTITEEYITAYKYAPIFAPNVSYFTDTAKQTNYVYGNLFKATVRHIFDDGEKSNWSEYSNVAIPDKESFTGNAKVSNLNNGLKIAVETGSRIVKQIEIGIKRNREDFVSIITLDKKRLGINDNSTYEYKFYNDNVSYSGLEPDKVARAYSFMSKKPALQALTKNAMVYGDGEEGFEPVDAVIEGSVDYSDLFLDPGTESGLNSPYFEQTYFKYIYSKAGDGRRRWSDIQLTIGHDVKNGNEFTLKVSDGGWSIDHTFTAGPSDNAVSIASAVKAWLVDNAGVSKTAPELPSRDIWVNEINGDGDISFRFILRGRFAEPEKKCYTSKKAVPYDSLKDTGQSVLTQKSGGSVKYGIIYWDEDTKRSNTYTSESAVVRNSFVTETAGYKLITHNLSIKHKPPKWAKYWELVRTVDLTYGNDFIHVLIQKAIESQSTTNTEYVDLVIGSLNTYQKMYPNTVINFQFEKNDRVRLIRKETGDKDYYPFFETVVLDYKDQTEETVNENVITDGSAKVTIGGQVNEDNIGRYISINGIERLITGVESGTKYLLDRDIKFTGTATEYPNYKIIDRRGVIRVRKPDSTTGITIEDNSLIEVYKPTQNKETGEKQFFLFQQKFPIINWGTDEAAHAGNVQNQDPDNPDTTPAIIKVSKGTTYVRNRALPTNNSIPGTQVAIDFVEDKHFSDFYESSLNDNGKVAPEDDGTGVIRFGDRLRFSNNYIEGTKLNGLNDFDNTDREDYNDIYGRFKLLKYRDGLLYAFKELKTGYIPINASIIQDQSGSQLLSASAKLLNQLQYFSWEGGIGNNPESFASNQNWMWFASGNSGTFCRIGGNGILPISKQFGVDGRIRELFDNSMKYRTRIFGGYDRENDEYIASFEPYNEYVFNGGFIEADWRLLSSELPEGTIFEITSIPLHGTVEINEDNLFNYTPDIDYIGLDNFYFRYKIPGGDWSEPKKQCIQVVEVENPPVDVTYYNTELIVPYTKSGCASGYHGTVVNYVVPAYKYSSVYSQEDADLQAQEDADANGQAKADTEGTCEINDPNAFSFTDQSGLEPSTLTESDSVVIDGPYDDYVISIDTGEYQINGGAWISTPGIIHKGDSVKVRNTTSADPSATVDTVLTIGSVSDTFSISTGIPLPDFDFMVLRYVWDTPAGSDLDTFTGFIETGTAYDNDYVGYAQGDAKVPSGSATPYIWWGADNTTGGVEAILLDINRFVSENPAAPNLIKVKMNAVWYSGKLTGDISVEVATYKGGTMAYDAPTKNFINTGGTIVSNIQIPFNVGVQSSTGNIADSVDVAILEYDKTTQTANLDMQGA